MRIEVAVTELRGVRVAIAFAPPAYVVPGAGDALLARLQPYFPALPVMLACVQKRGMRTHAAFQAHALAEGADLGALPRSELDLDVAPPLPDQPPPF